MSTVSANLGNQLKIAVAQVLSINNERLEEININESSFIQLGGDSLQAMQVVAMVSKACGVDIPIEFLLSNNKLGEIEEKLLKGRREKNFNKPLELKGMLEQGSNIATSSQQGIWFMQEVFGKNDYNLAFTTHMNGTVIFESLIESIHLTVKRHEGLRTYFRSTDVGLTSHVKLEFSPKVDVITIEDSNKFDELCGELIRRESQQIFNLQDSPPLKFSIMTDEKTQHKLLFIVHHTLIDGWSVGIIINEILDHYESLINKKKLSLESPTPLKTYKDFETNLIKTGIVKKQLNYWEKAIQGYPTTIELKMDSSKEMQQKGHGERKSYTFTKEKTDLLKKAAKELEVTPSTLFLSAFGLALSRYTGNKRLIIGVPTPNRPTFELQNLVGLCTNVSPVLIEVNEDDSVREYIKKVFNSVNETLSNSNVSLDEIVKRLKLGRRDIQKNPLIQYVFGAHDQLIKRRRKINDTTIEITDGHGGGSPFDMTLFIQYSDPFFGGEIEYSAETLNNKEINLFSETLFNLLNSFVQKAGSKIEDIRGISQNQMDILDSINNTKSDYKEKNIDQLFLEQVKNNPDIEAVVSPFEKRSLTYKELEKASLAHAKYLIESGVKPGDLVIVALERSLAEAVVLISILRIGATYVAVDPDWPVPRIETIIKTANSKFIIGSNKFKNKVNSFNGSFLKPWDNQWTFTEDIKLPILENDLDRLAYITFTSGSTGTPKGVSVKQRGIIRLIKGINYTNFGKGERFLRFAPLAFDASTLEIWGPLLNGGTCLIYEPGIPSPNELGNFIFANNITRLWLTSGLFRLLAEFCPDSFSKVRQLITGGDVVTPEHVQKVLSINPDLLVTNGYGPTENTTFTTTYTLSKYDEIEDPLPIGYPISNTRVYILDEQNRLLPPGAIGELCVSGDGLAEGYIGNEKETKRCFGKFSADINEQIYKTGDIARIDTRGRLQYIGRRDHQVKIRGHRIELEEIRKTIKEDENVIDAVVITIGETSSERKLIAAVILKEEDSKHLIKLNKKLKGILPKYMLPSRWAIIDQIPINANGKVDNKKLESICKVIAPNSIGDDLKKEGDLGIYNEIKEIMQEILKLDNINESDNFFELGGDSLGMAQLMGVIREVTGYQISLKEFYVEPTLGRLVELIQRESILKTNLIEGDAKI